MIRLGIPESSQSYANPMIFAPTICRKMHKRASHALVLRHTEDKRPQNRIWDWTTF
jgi:hypothetical protein